MLLFDDLEVQKAFVYDRKQEEGRKLCDGQFVLSSSHLMTENAVKRLVV